MIELVIFDCDGVLVDSERLAVKINVRVLAQLGWRITEAEVIERLVGVSDAHFRQQIESHLGVNFPTTGTRSPSRCIGALMPLNSVLSMALLMP